jgi:hypothetical protein
MSAVVWAAGQRVTAASLNAMEGTNALTAPTTVANTITETAIATWTIPAGDAVAGSVYRMTAWGVGSVTLTPTITWRVRVGGMAGPSSGQSGARTASSGIANHCWKVVTELCILTGGAAGTTGRQVTTTEALSVAGGAPFVSPAVITDGTTNGTIDTTITNDFVLTILWSAAAAGNTITCNGAFIEHVI